MKNRMQAYYQMPGKWSWYMLVIAGVSLVCYVGTGIAFVLLGGQPWGDEPHFLVISQTLLKYHSLDVMADYLHGDYHSFYILKLDPHVTTSIQGNVLPLHSIGGPLLWLLPFFLLGRLGAVLFMAVLSVFIIVNIYLFLQGMGINQRIAFLVTLVYTIASPLYIYSYRTFIEPIGALVCIYVMRKIMERDIRMRSLLFSSLLLSVLPWVHIRMVLIQFPLLLALGYRIYQQYGWHKWRYYVAYLMPVVVFWLLFEIYTLLVWGTLNPAANQIADGSQSFEVWPFAGLFGILFDQDHGLMVCFPLCAFLIAGIIVAQRKDLRFYNLCVLCLSAPYILIFTTFRHWYGGWAPPARFILVLLPVYAFYMAYVIQLLRKNIVVYGMIAVALVWGTFYNILSLLPPVNGFNDEKGKNQTLVIINKWWHIPLTSYLPSVLQPLTFQVAFWVGLYALLTAYIVYLVWKTHQISIRPSGGL